MAPLLLFAGVVALGAGFLLLRRFGPRYRVGRLLAATPHVTVAEARALAVDGRARYVAISGRIDAEDEFEDADHRPLVFRRSRLEALSGRNWTRLGERIEAVDFAINEGLDQIEVDRDVIDDGLVVVPRESVGVAADAPDRVPAEMPPTTPIRVRIEQLSSVEHAVVLGVPALDAGSGRIRMTAGLGRPLILTTLERDEAMRILAADHAGLARAASACLVAGVALLALAAVVAGLGAILPALVPAVRAASHESPTPLPVGGDPRSEGEGPGLVGEPGIAILGVLAIGLVSVVITMAWVRLTDRPAGPPRHR